METLPLRLGVNIDHVATIRNARGINNPDPVRAAHLAAKSGADGITAHLREDRRHISDEDIQRLTNEIDLPLNLEIAATDEMLAIALRHRPHAVCIVPEKRQELTTEGGLDVIGGHNILAPVIDQLNGNGSRVSLFVDPVIEQLNAAKSLGAPVVELHAGKYCEASSDERDQELARLATAAAHAHSIGLECHVGHGLDYDTVEAVAELPNVVELNIGHFLIGEAIFVGLEKAIQRMRQHMDRARDRIAGNA